MGKSFLISKNEVGGIDLRTLIFRSRPTRAPNSKTRVKVGLLSQQRWRKAPSRASKRGINSGLRRCLVCGDAIFFSPSLEGGHFRVFASTTRIRSAASDSAND